MSEAEVRRERPGEGPIAARVLADAFIEEGGLNYWLRQGRPKESARQRFFDAVVADVMRVE